MALSSLLVKDGRGMASQRQRQAQRRIPLIETRELGPGLAPDQLKGRERLVPAPDELLIYQERVKPAPHQSYNLAARRGIIQDLTEPRERVWLHASYGLASFLADHHGGRLFVPGDAVLSARRSTMRLWRDRDQTIAPRTRTSRRLTQTDVEGYISKAPSPRRRASAPPSAPTPTTKIASNPFALLAHDTVTHLAAASRPSPPRAQPAGELDREALRLRRQERDAAKSLARQRKEAARLAAKKDRDDMVLIDKVMRKDAAAAEAKEKRAEAARVKAVKAARLLKEAEEKAAKREAAKSQAARSQAHEPREEQHKQVQGAAKQEATEVPQKAVKQETEALALKRARVTAAVAAAKAALAQAPVVEAQQAPKVPLPQASSSTAVPVDQVQADKGAEEQAPACAAGGGLKACAPAFVPKTPVPRVQADVLDDSSSSSVVSTGPFQLKAGNIYMSLPRLSDATASTLSDMDSSTSSACARPPSHSHALSSLSCDLSASGDMEAEPKGEEEEQQPLCSQALMVDGEDTCDGAPHVQEGQDAEAGEAEVDIGTSLAPSAEGAAIEREGRELDEADDDQASQVVEAGTGAPCDEQEGNSPSGRASARAPAVEGDELDDSSSASEVSTGPFQRKQGNMFLNLPRFSDATDSGLDISSATSVGEGGVSRTTSRSHASSVSMDVSASGALEEAEPKVEEEEQRLCSQALVVDGEGTCDGQEGQAAVSKDEEPVLEMRATRAPSAEGAGIEREDLEVVVAAEEEARQAAKPDIGAPCDEQEGNSLSGRASARAPPVEGDELDDSNSSSDVSTGPFQRKGGNMYLSLPRFSDATDSGLDISSATSVGEGCVSRTTSRSHASSLSMDVSASGALEEAEPKGEEGEEEELCSQALMVDGEDTEEEELHGEEGQAAASKDDEPALEMRASCAPSADTAGAEVEVQELDEADDDQASQVVEPGTGAPCDEQEGNSPSNDACADDVLDNACLADTTTHHHSSSTVVEPEEGEASAKASNTRGFKALTSSVQDSEHREVSHTIDLLALHRHRLYEARCYS
jgi:hypothetical protein